MSDYTGFMNQLEAAALLVMGAEQRIDDALENLTRIHTLGGVGLPPVGVDAYREALGDGRLDYQQTLLSAAKRFAQESRKAYDMVTE